MTNDIQYVPIFMHSPPTLKNNHKYNNTKNDILDLDARKRTLLLFSFINNKILLSITNHSKFKQNNLGFILTWQIL